MKSKLKCSALILGGALMALVFVGIPVRTGSGESVASENGDTNGDGVLDISDAVYLLIHLFQQGPPPVAIAADDNADSLARIASALEEIASPCRERPDRFFDNGDGTVTDQCTWLMWQQAPSATDLNWEQAKEYSEGLSLGGHTNWRLPSALELETILYNGRYGTHADPATSLRVYPAFKLRARIDQDKVYYWSSDPAGPVGLGRDTAWAMWFVEGKLQRMATIFTGSASSTNSAIAVRDL